MAARDTAKVALHNAQGAWARLRGADRALYLEELGAMLRSLSEAP